MSGHDEHAQGAGLDRRMLLAMGAALALSACAPGNGKDKKKDAGRPRSGPCPHDTAALRDKFLGMLLLGAYGDALGGPHEFPDGLNGKTTDPGTLRRLPPLGRYRRDSASPWGIWPDPSSIDRAKKGVVTDDTSFRVAILHQWLCELVKWNEAPSEAGFLAWLKARKAPPADASQWRKSRYAQIRAWVCMLEDGKRLKANREGFTPRDCQVDGKKVQTFFRKDVPVVFGPFLYLELAAIYACCPRERIYRQFRDFSCLDQSYGKEFTGLLAAMMAAAMCNTSKDVGFGDWFCRFADGTLAAAPGDAAARRRLKAAFDTAKRFGKANRGLGEKEFIEKLKRELYDPHMAADPDHQRIGFENFDPLLFLKEMAAAAGYAGRDMRKALRVLAAGPGDADTVPSFLGSIMGAWCGAKRLKAGDPELSADLAAVADCIKRLYGIEIDRIVDCLVELADKHGCCRKSGGSGG